MRYEQRLIKASLMAGLSDIAVGILMYLTGWHAWYFEHFHMFGIIGIGMIFYAGWHQYFYTREVKYGNKQ